MRPVDDPQMAVVVGLCLMMILYIYFQADNGEF